MTTHLSLTHEYDAALPPGYADEVRTPEPLVEHAIREYSDPGDDVVDPFAGFGTTLVVAERLGRTPHGLEYEPDRVAHVRDRIETAGTVHRGDALTLDPDRFPDCECAFTSPPFMTRSMERNPFENYAGESSYERYLDDVETAFGRLESILAPGGRVVIDVANVNHEGEVTPLAWDVARRVSRTFRFDGEVVVAWEPGEYNDRTDPDERGGGTYGYGYDHTYCLVFTNADD